MPKLKWITAIIFIVLVLAGFQLALYKPLWNDEIYTQVASIGQRSFSQLIFEGPGFAEANNCPLFYLLQKAIVQSAGYETPQAWIQDRWDYEDIPTRMILRIQPVIFMSLALALIFYFLARRSLWSGLVGLALGLSSYMVWLYWAEARHYALWFLLTTLQIFIFLDLWRDPGGRRWIFLAVIQTLLALTAIFSLGQIVGITLLLIVGRKMTKPRPLIATGLIPTLVCFYFYLKVAHGPFKYWVEGGVKDFLIPCFSLERLIVIGILAVIIVFHDRIRRREHQTQRDLTVWPIVGMTVLWWAAAATLLLIFKINSTSPDVGNPISMRYFIFLTPISIIVPVLMAQEFFQLIRPNAWLTVNGAIILTGVLILDFLNNGYWVITLW